MCGQRGAGPRRLDGERLLQPVPGAQRGPRGARRVLTDAAQQVDHVGACLAQCRPVGIESRAAEAAQDRGSSGRQASERTLDVAGQIPQPTCRRGFRLRVQGALHGARQPVVVPGQPPQPGDDGEPPGIRWRRLGAGAPPAQQTAAGWLVRLRLGRDLALKLVGEGDEARHAAAGIVHPALRAALLLQVAASVRGQGESPRLEQLVIGDLLWHAAHYPLLR